MRRHRFSGCECPRIFALGCFFLGAWSCFSSLSFTVSAAGATPTSTTVDERSSPSHGRPAAAPPSHAAGAMGATGALARNGGISQARRNSIVDDRVPRRISRPITSGHQVTKRTIREALRGASLPASQEKVFLHRVRSYVDRLLAGETAPAILVQDGVLADGHHRYVAGRIVGKEPARRRTTKYPHAVAAQRPWSKVSVSHRTLTSGSSL